MRKITTAEALAALPDAQIRAGLEALDRLHYSARTIPTYEEKVHLFRVAVARAATEHAPTRGTR